MTSAERQKAMLPPVKSCESVAGQIARAIDNLDVLASQIQGHNERFDAAVHSLRSAKLSTQAACEELKRIALA